MNRRLMWLLVAVVALGTVAPSRGSEGVSTTRAALLPKRRQASRPPSSSRFPGAEPTVADSAGQFIDGYRRSMADGVVALAPIASDVDADVVRAVEARQAEAVAGTFHVSSGSINDQDGYEAVAAGEALEDGAMLGKEFFVQGAIGTLW